MTDSRNLNWHELTEDQKQGLINKKPVELSNTKIFLYGLLAWVIIMGILTLIYWPK